MLTPADYIKIQDPQARAQLFELFVTGKLNKLEKDKMSDQDFAENIYPDLVKLEDLATLKKTMEEEFEVIDKSFQVIKKVASEPNPIAKWIIKILSGNK